MSPIESNLQHVKACINAAIARLPQERQRPVTLVAVSKAKTVVELREAFAAGQRAFGENYVQEGVAKIEAMADLRSQGLLWHFIGPLQSNKARHVAQHFDWMHTIDRLKIAQLLSAHRHGLSPLNVCLQINISGEASKSGVAPADAQVLAGQITGLPALKFRGLMAIIENTPDETAQRMQFRMMHQLFDEMNRGGLAIDTLSMGMSLDYSVAIEEGATMVRVGSAIFGARS
jgi:PLP dependent protein